MFLDIREIERNSHSYFFKIIDSDFEEGTWCEIIYGSVGDKPHPMYQKYCATQAKAIIDIYSKKNLDVPRNLFLYLMFRHKGKDVFFPYYVKHVPGFENYIPQLKKYILFL